MDGIKIAEAVLGVAGIGAVFWASFRGNLSGETIKIMKDNKSAQDQAIKRLEVTTTEQTGQIAELTGQVKLLRDIPLGQIAKSLETVSATHRDLQQFLKDHQTQSTLLADGIADKVIQFLKDKQ